MTNQTHHFSDEMTRQPATAGAKQYMVSPNPSDSFDAWVDSGEYFSTIDEARKARTRIAEGMGLPSRAVWIWNTYTGAIVE